MRAEYIQDQHPELTCLVFDLSGHGGSSGDLDQLAIHQHLDDALAAYDHLTELEEVDSRNIGVAGSSYGGYLTALISAERNPKSVQLRAPAIYADDWYDKSSSQISPEEKTKYRAVIDDQDDNKALRALKSYQGPVMIIESELDKQVPQNVVRAYRDAAVNNPGLSYKVMKSAPHTLETEQQHTEYKQLLSDWFYKTLDF